jgi:hypothetical protein
MEGCDEYRPSAMAADAAIVALGDGVAMKFAASSRDQRGTTRLEAACADRRIERCYMVLIRRLDIET